MSNMDKGDKFVAAILSVSYVDKTHHPLHLGLEREVYDRIFKKDDAVTVVSLISREQYDKKRDSDVDILHCCVVPLDTKPSAQVVQLERSLGVSEKKHLRLVCSQNFVNLYGLDAGSTVLIKNSTLLPVDKVVISAKTVESFQWAEQRLFSTGLLLSVCENKVLVRKGDPLLPKYADIYDGHEQFSMSLLMDLVVIDSKPVHQGLLTVQTEVVICPEEEAKAEDTPLKQTRSTELQVENVLSLETFKRNLNIKQDFSVDYTSIIGLSKNTFKSLNVNHDTLVLVSYKSLQDLDEVTEASGEGRKSSVASLDAKTAKLLKSPKQAENRRLCRAILYDDASDHTIYMLPVLNFNLAGGADPPKDLQICIERYNPGEKEGPSLLSVLENLSVPYATEIHVSLVSSPSYSSGIPCNSLLHLYFQCTRYIKEGDIMCLKTSEDPEYECEQQERFGEVYPVVYFKVTKVKPSGKDIFICRADIHNTSLFQGADVHSYVPVKMGHALDARMRMPSAAEAGLKMYADDVCQTLRPYLAEGSESLATLLLSGVPGSGKMTVVEMAAAELGLHILKINCHDVNSDNPATSEAKIKNVLQQALSSSPCILVLRNIQAICKDRDGLTEDPRVANSFKELLAGVKDTNWPFIVIGTSVSSSSLVSADLQEAFLHTMNIEVPDEYSRGQMLLAMLKLVPHCDNLEIRSLAQRTAGFVLGDLIELINSAKRNAVSRTAKKWMQTNGQIDVVAEAEIASSGPMLMKEDIDKALDALHNMHSQSSHSAKIPQVYWEDIGGLAEVKEEILDTIQLPLQQPELFASGLRRSGVLLYGPPGTGKTLLAKAVSTECSLNFLSVKGPELINMYVGQSEENVREVFNQARNASPCVIFFDELDSLAPNRGRSGDSGGVMDRVVSQLLAELDGLHKSCDVFVIGATNRPDLLDPALLRPGRFDKLLYLGINRDKQAKLNILQALTRKFKLAKDCDLEMIAENCPENLTGADIYALSSDAMLNAIKRQISVLKTDESADNEVTVALQDFIDALNNLVPSVSIQEMHQYDVLSQSLRSTS